MWLNRAEEELWKRVGAVVACLKPIRWFDGEWVGGLMKAAGLLGV